MAIRSEPPDEGRQSRDAAGLPVALTNAPDLLPVLTDEVALIVLLLGPELSAILNEDQ